MTVRVLLIITLFSLFSCQRKTEVIVAEQEQMDIVANKIDPTVNPADDFFNWANGGWFKAFPMPPTESEWGIESMVNEEIFQKTITLCRNASVSNAPKGSVEQKIGDLWATGMDTLTIENQDITYIEPILNRISNIKDFKSFFSVTGQIHAYNISPLFYGYTYQDKRQSDKYTFFIGQGGLSVYAREYYLKNDDLHKRVRNAYLMYLIKTFMNIGESERIAQQHASSVLKIETFLAEKHLSISELESIYENYNKFAIKDLEKITPSVSWQILFKNMGYPSDSVVVEQLDYIQHLDKGFKQFALEEWKNYLKFYFLNSIGGYLPKRFRYSQFDFYGKIIDGRKQKKTQWKFLLENEERLLGDALGKTIVKEFFPEKTQKRYTDITENIKKAFAESINEAPWLSEITKKQALQKLSKMKSKIGYPNHWKDFNNMEIDKKSFVNNILNANQWWFSYQMSKLNKRVDRTEWNITPQEYNAYYSPANNEIVVSAAVLTIPGFSDDQIDDAVAYGYAAAATIGHEMTHGFDMEGKEYDMNGNMENWWMYQDSISFVKKASPLIKQFNKYIVIDTFHCKGEATWNENIADLGGVSIALRAFKKTEQYKKGEKIAGYTPLQRFFMGYALAWMTNYTKERMIRKVITDDHAPPKWRINGILSNIPEFYEAFKVKPYHKMWLDESKRVHIW